MFHAVIFDMDGVIIDSEPAHYDADSAMFKKLGIHLSHDERDLFLGVSSEWMWNYILAKYPVRLSKSEILAMDVSVRGEFLLAPDRLKVNPGVVDFIRRLLDAGIPLAVASSTVEGLLKQILTELDLFKYFSQIAAGDEVKHAKPEPDVFMLAANRLNVPPSLCLAIEDSPNGIKAAKSAGMKCIGYSSLLNSIKLQEADIIIQHFDQLSLSLIQSVFNNEI